MNMAKLYRLIPNTVATICETGYICDISEDLFYKLGYISINDHMNGYLIDRGNSWARKTESGIFFYFSPWSCLENLLYLNDVYGNEIARIFEYELDDEIINSLPQGYGYYRGIPSKEIKVPIKVLVEKSIVNTKFTTELKIKLTNIALCYARESFKKLKKSITENETSQLRCVKDFYSLENKYFNSGRAERINARRLTNCGNFFKSDVITGKSTIITMSQRKKLYDFINNGRNIQQIYELCENSNGIFTIENLIDFYGDKCDFSNLDIAPARC